ncbi:SDR family NAD(P)-dependent oxidoreductase [Metallosphaera javensis (ex Sakai et al. 2022)]|uniref:SDR family NAD(P)-dependent oxidoreductase n=1 Tax=Metallosphaera javensis (ex Sakai et al. 2022) TaxID=2775498 RepID=UPI00258854EE|nr:MAG: 3-oxoacyl-[acyl-carrier-protein] reductase FabG [Metallosphaera javensis (ex Sakai et al. 2022)]
MSERGKALQELSGKVSLVAGALGGIGEAISSKLADMGSDLILVARDSNGLTRLKEKLMETHRETRIWTYPMDLSSVDEVRGKGKEIVSTSGKVDILVYNAGVNSPHHFLDLDLEEWETIINTNLRGAFLLLKEIVPEMMTKKYGRIVIMSSIVAKTGGLGKANLAYTVSKAGLLGLTRNLAKYLAPYNITVNAVAPSFIETDMLRKTGFDQRLEELKKLHPLGRIGTPEDVANVVAFLVSDASSFITGETVNVNGGLLMD